MGFCFLGGLYRLFMYRLPVNSNTACVPHTPYTLVLKFVPPAGRVCGAATHAVGGDAGYGLLISGDDKALKLIQIWNHLYKIHNYSMHDHDRKVDKHNFDDVECFVWPYRSHYSYQHLEQT